MKRSSAVVLMFALVTAACGDGSSPDAAAETTLLGSGAPSTTTTSVATTTTAAPAPTTTTTPPTTTTTAAGIIPGEDENVDAIVLAYEIAFSSESDYETKAPYIEEPDGLEDTVAQYLVTGETMGGVRAAVTGVTVEGETATVTYDLMFNDNPTYPGLTGDAVLTEAGWQIPRGTFCTLMASARVGCPDS